MLPASHSWSVEHGGGHVQLCHPEFCEAPLWGPASHQQLPERGKLPTDIRLALPLWLIESPTAWEQSGPQPWATGQALLGECGVPSCSSPHFVDTAYSHHPSGINSGQEQREGNQEAPFPIPALLLHQPLPTSRLKFLSGH